MDGNNLRLGRRMKKVGFVGLGDMGLAMAQNILKAGFPLVGFDLRDARLQALEQAGGQRVGSCREVGTKADTVFVMVLNGRQVQQVIAGPDGLLDGLRPGATIIVSATITPLEMKAAAEAAQAKGMHVIDTPVSGGLAGASAGTLTLMTAAPTDVLAAQRDVLEAVAGQIFHVGEEIGAGQTVKASLQALIGTSFVAVFEALVLAAKSGVKGETFYDVLAASAAGSPLVKNAARFVLERQFTETGSTIATMYKDLGITMNMARANGVPMFATAAALELFQAGISRFPDEDNWSVAKVLEEMAVTKASW